MSEFPTDIEKFRMTKDNEPQDLRNETPAETAEQIRREAEQAEAPDEEAPDEEGE